jgi:hypothetical protein
VIVKLAEIRLTPEKPKYEGGGWHIEGMQNERIVATVVHYYGSENVTESRLAFCCDVDDYAVRLEAERRFPEDDWDNFQREHFTKHYGLGEGKPTDQVRHTASTGTQGRIY